MEGFLLRKEADVINNIDKIYECEMGIVYTDFDASWEKIINAVLIHRSDFREIMEKIIDRQRAAKKFMEYKKPAKNILPIFIIIDKDVFNKISHHVYALSSVSMIEKLDIRIVVARPKLFADRGELCKIDFSKFVK